MGLYANVILPRLINLVMRNKDLSKERAKIIPAATGTVLEIGVGSGLNLPFYGPGVTQLHGVDPSAALLKMARRHADRLPFPVQFLEQSAEHLPFPDESMDSVVATWVLCSIPDPATALREMKRVLKPGGRLIFTEHGRSPDASVVRWQDRLNPVWRRFSGGCNLNRKTDELIRGAGFELVELRNCYLPGPRPMTYTYQGSAV